MAEKTIRDVTFELLRQLELTTLFGNPGSTEETFLKTSRKIFVISKRYMNLLLLVPQMAMLNLQENRQSLMCILPRV